MGNARSAFGYPQNVLRRFSADTPHRTVRAAFPHTALRVGLVSSVSLPFASRLRFTLIPMDAPPYGRAVSDAPPHSGLSPIAAFRHYCSRHLICIVPFYTQRPFASERIDARKPECPNARMPECPNARMPECSDASRTRSTRSREKCPDAQSPRCPDAVVGRSMPRSGVERPTTAFFSRTARSRRAECGGRRGRRATRRRKSSGPARRRRRASADSA